VNSTDRPRYVVPTPPEAVAVLSRLARAGWTVQEGFALAEPTRDITGARLVLFGPVPDLHTVQLAVLAAARGAGVVAICDPSSGPGRALIDDLSRLGPVHRQAAPHPAADPAAAPRSIGAKLIPEQRALLERLANGETIAAAAAAEFLSLRTANRRIAHAREVLGVRTTREAVLVYLRQRG
jgi:DNA-binding CsgD family transcriptional regulator